MAVLHLPALRRPLRNHVDYGLDVHTGLLAEMHRFRQSLHHASDAYLVHHLGQLPRSGLTEQSAGLSERHDHRLGAIERGLVATHHHGKLAVLGTSLPARHWRVEEVEATSLGRRIEFARDACRRRRVVDEQRPFADALEGAIRPECHFAQIIVIAHTGKNDVLPFRRLARRPGQSAALLANPFLRLGERTIVYRDVMTFRLEMAGHGKAHDTQTDECCFDHDGPFQTVVSV